MDIHEFLLFKDTDLPSVLAAIDAQVRLDSDVLLLAAGSVTEGLGNIKSDLDLILVAPDSETRTASSDEIQLVVGRCLIDVLLVRTADVEALVARLSAWCRCPWDVSRKAAFTLEERTLLHRLRHGIALVKGDRSVIFEQRPSLGELARLKLHVARHLARTIQVDMVGYREIGDYRTLVFAAQDLLGQVIDGLVAGYLLTNPNAKWRSRLLDLVPSDWERVLPLRPTGLLASERVWRLHRAPSRPDEVDASVHALAITIFARAVFAWAEHELVRSSDAESEHRCGSVTASNAYSSSSVVLDLDVDFVLGDGLVAIARLNEFGQALTLSPAEFQCALLLDGAASATVNNSASSTMDRVVSEVARAGLSVSWPFHQDVVG